MIKQLSVSDSETHLLSFPEQFLRILAAESDYMPNTVYIDSWKRVENPSLVQTSQTQFPNMSVLNPFTELDLILLKQLIILQRGGDIW